MKLHEIKENDMIIERYADLFKSVKSLYNNLNITVAAINREQTRDFDPNKYIIDLFDKVEKIFIKHNKSPF